MTKKNRYFPFQKNICLFLQYLAYLLLFFRFTIVVLSLQILYLLTNNLIFTSTFWIQNYFLSLQILYFSANNPIFTSTFWIQNYFSIFANFVYCGNQTKFTVPIGPFLCFAIIISAIFLSGVSLL